MKKQYYTELLSVALFTNPTRQNKFYRLYSDVVSFWPIKYIVSFTGKATSKFQNQTRFIARNGRIHDSLAC